MTPDQRLAMYLGSVYRAMNDEADVRDPHRTRRDHLVRKLDHIASVAASAYLHIMKKHPAEDGWHVQRAPRPRRRRRKES